MNRIALALALFSVLSACNLSAPGGAPAAENAARTVVRSIMADRAPGRSGEVFTDCVIDNASTAELIQIGAAGLGAPSEGILRLVTTILQRPATQSCVAQGLVSG